LTLFELAEFPLPKKHPRPGRRGKRYTRDSYRVAVVRAAAAADLAAHKRQPEVPQAQRIIPHWTPNQLRHSAADALERRFGKDAARAVLGHSDDDTTDIYLTRDFETAARIMAEVG
jgi:integrase